MSYRYGRLDGDVVLGVVGNGYTYLQNIESFTFFDHIESADRWINSIWFGDGYLAKARAFRVANELLKAA